MIFRTVRSLSTKQVSLGPGQGRIRWTGAGQRLVLVVTISSQIALRFGLSRPHQRVDLMIGNNDYDQACIGIRQSDFGQFLLRQSKTGNYRMWIDNRTAEANFAAFGEEFLFDETSVKMQRDTLTIALPPYILTQAG